MSFREKLMVGMAALLPLSFAAAQEPEPAPFSMGNGESNWIRTEDVSRVGSIFTFKEVHIDGAGWLVMHPFEDGAPNGDKYVAATYLASGTNSDVDIEVYKDAASGEMFIVMLHRDSNDNGIFDFVFVDSVNVMDRAVFEGSRMIGHAVATD